MPYVRTVKTSSGATAVQIVYSSHRGSRQIEHLGSAHDGAGVELLKAAARQRLAAGQGELDLGLAVGAPGGPLPIMSSRMGHLLDGLAHAFGVLGFGGVTGGDEVFAQLVLARIIEPTSKLDAARVLEEAGLEPVSYATLKRRLPAYAKDAWRRKLSPACAEHARLGPASLVLYDVSTLYFETDAGDGFRESGFSKERRLEPQITIGLLTDQGGFPLMVSAFEGNKAETKTMLPVIREFMAAHQLPDVTVVADAGMVSEANQKEIEAAGLSFILGQRVPEVPWVVAEWHREHPGAAVPDGHVFTQRWPAGPNSGRRDKVIYYQYRHDRGRRTLRGIDEQVAKAAACVREGGLAAADLGCLRGARGAGAGQPGAIRRVHLVFRDRCGRWVPRAWLSKERRLDPQITIGLLTDACGFPLMVSALGEQGRDQDDAAGDQGVPWGLVGSISVAVFRRRTCRSRPLARGRLLRACCACAWHADLVSELPTYAPGAVPALDRPRRA